MKGIYTPVTKIRRQVFQEIARLAFEGGDYSRMEELPYKIIPGEVANYRDSVFKERAIVGCAWPADWMFARRTSMPPFPRELRPRRSTGWSMSRRSSTSSPLPARPAPPSSTR